jgi:hypothetical protein
MADAHQLGQGELDADGKEEKNDTDLRHLLDIMGRFNQAQGIGAGQDPGNEKTDNRRDHQFAKEDHRDQGEAKEDLEIFQGLKFHDVDRVALLCVERKGGTKL